jgi:acetyl-CoA carboxylase biotin carboxyl carrier protein
VGSDGGAGRGERPPAPAEVESLVRSLAGLMRGGGITELDVTFGAVSIRLRAALGPAAPAPSEPSVAGPLVAVAAPAVSEHVIAAPMIGTFYAAPAPGAPPLVEIGDRVEVGQTIGIIEAMKIMNEIAADRGGVVTAILVTNAQAVEYGSPLIRLLPDEPA